MTTFALDLGMRCGWAIGYTPTDIDHGVMEFRHGRYEGGGMAYLRFKRWLSEMHDQHGPLTAIYFEEVRRHAGTDAAHVHGGFLGHLTAWCEQREVPYQGIPVGTIKKAATGRGNCGKPEMIAAMRELGFEPEDDNDADALALLLCVMDKETA